MSEKTNDTSKYTPLHQSNPPPIDESNQRDSGVLSQASCATDETENGSLISQETSSVTSNPTSPRDTEGTSSTSMLRTPTQDVGPACAPRIRSSMKQSTMAPDSISNDQQCWKRFLNQGIKDHFGTGKTFEVSSVIFPGDHVRHHGNLVSLFVRESFELLFQAIIEEPSSLSLVPYIITGTPGVGISSFGFYLLRHLIETMSPGESILYQYTIYKCLKYVRIERSICTASKPYEVTCYDVSPTAHLNLAVSWYVCDGKSNPFKFRTIEIVSSPLSYDTNSANCFYMPLWKKEEVENMLEQVYPESREAWLSAEIKNDTEFEARKQEIVASFKTAMLDILKSMDTTIMQFDGKLQTPESVVKDMDTVHSDFNIRYKAAKQNYSDKIKDETTKFHTQTSELKEQHFHQLNDASWALEYIGLLPSAYLRTKENQRSSEKQKLDREISNLLKNEDVLELHYMGKNDSLPPVPGVSPRMLHVTCTYDGNKPNFKEPSLRIASRYVLEKLRTPMSAGKGKRYLDYLALQNLPLQDIGIQVFEPAVHAVITEGLYKAYELGTCESPKMPPKMTTLEVKFQNRKKVNVTLSKKKWQIEVKSEDEKCYCEPSLPDFPVIDSFIPSQFYLFQITISNTHLVNTKRLLEILTQLKWLDKVKNVKLIFIVLENKNDQLTAQGPEKADEVDSKEYEKFAQIKQYRLVFPQDPEPL